MQKPFLIGEAIRYGWHTTRAHSALVFKVVLTLLALEVANSVVQKVLEGTALGLLASIVLTVLSFVLGIGATRMVLHIAHGKHATYAELIPPTTLIWPYLGASILAGLSVIGGLILLIIPGIIVAVRLSMVRFIVVEGAGIRESLNKSWAMTRGHTLNLLGLFLVLILLNILGAIALMVGLLVSMPVSMFAFAHVYLKLKAHH